MIKNSNIMKYICKIFNKVNFSYYFYVIFFIIFLCLMNCIKNNQSIAQEYIKPNKYINIIENNNLNYVNKIFIKNNTNFFIIQIATYSSENEAWNRYRILKNEFHLNSFIEKKVLINNTIKFRLCVGPFRSLEVANIVKNKLFILGYNNSVILNSE